MTLSAGQNGAFRLNPTFADQYAQFEIVQTSSDVQYGCWHELAGGKTDRLEIQLGYRRSRDFDKSDSAGQDFAVARCNQGHFVGLVADGVSQSYFGDLAARHLGTHLLELLWNTRQQLLNTTDLERELKLMQESLAALVAGHHVDHLPEAVRHALERTRSLGSQAVFAAVIWDLYSHCLTAYRVGDVRLWVRSADSNVTEVNADPTGRFSSAARSQLKLASQQVLRAEGLFLKTDGVALNWGNDCNFDEITEDSFAAMANDRADIDDVSFLAASLDRSQRMEFKNTLLLLPATPLAEQRPVVSRPAQAPLLEKPETRGPDRRRIFLAGAFWGFLAASILFSALFAINTFRLRKARPSASPTSAPRPAQAVTPAANSNNIDKPVSLEFGSEAIPRKLFMARYAGELPPMIREFLKKHPNAIVVRFPEKDNAGHTIAVSPKQSSDQETLAGQSTKNPNTAFSAINPGSSRSVDVRVTAELQAHVVQSMLSLNPGNCYDVSVQSK